MTKLRFLFIPLLTSLMLTGCSRMNEQELLDAALSLHKEKKFAEAIEKYEELVDRFEESPKAESAQMAIASIYSDDMQQYEKAISALHRAIELFPTGDAAPKALFMIGFIYNNQLHNFDSSRVAYENFLAAYPDNEMAPSARFELDNLGKEVEQFFAPAPVTEEEPPVAEKPRKK